MVYVPNSKFHTVHNQSSTHHLKLSIPYIQEPIHVFRKYKVNAKMSYDVNGVEVESYNYIS